MPSMTKRVNVYAQIAIRNITPPIYGTRENIIMTTGDILKCLCKRARVEEILPDGSTVRLNMHNYYLDNGAGLDASKNITKEEKKSSEENPTRFKVPVAPKAQVVETKPEIEMKQNVTENASTEIAPEENIAECVSKAETDVDIPVCTSGYMQVIDNTVNNNDDIEATTTITTAVSANTSNNSHNHHSNKKNKKK